MDLKELIASEDSEWRECVLLLVRGLLMTWVGRLSKRTGKGGEAGILEGDSGSRVVSFDVSLSNGFQWVSRGIEVRLSEIG